MADTYAIELTAPDITRWRDGNAGVPYFHSFDSGRPGPHVMVAAVTHGNELCGAIAVDWLLREGVRPLRGRLTLGFNNWAACLAFDPANPTASRFVEEDFNRLWDAGTLDGPRDSAELRRAREIRPLVDSVDYLLDIHSMQNATPPLMLAGPHVKGANLARALGYPRHVVCDEGHAAGRRLRDYGGFGDPASPKNALLVECGQHWEKASKWVAEQTTLRFLKELDVIDPAFIAAHLDPAPLPPQQVIEVTHAVTVERDGFAFAADFRGMEVIARQGDLIARDEAGELRAPYDNCVLIMPSRRLTKGLTAVRLGRIVA